ncbi:MAG: adenylosuccinate lyase, partial [Muribaculaceae bacterium]|nr:adenylosuccinate lyase [Muribaculaceae bacterium]
MTDLNSLMAVSPVDGRYHAKTAPLAQYFSEYALIRYRVKVEVEYFIALAEHVPQLASLPDCREQFRDIYRNFTPEDAAHVKEIESVTNHDVKAVEYLLKEKFDALGLAQWKEFIHFGLTSQDINNTAVPMSIADALTDVYMPLVERLLASLRQMEQEYADVAMLAKTHGQPASPTRLGKEIGVFAYRLEQQLNMLKQTLPLSGKFGGATGNFNAHRAAFPTVDWRAFANMFLSERLGIQREALTTQISNYDNLAAVFDALRRINTVVFDLDRDMWM